MVYPGWYSLVYTTGCIAWYIPGWYIRLPPSYYPGGIYASLSPTLVVQAPLTTRVVQAPLTTRVVYPHPSYTWCYTRIPHTPGGTGTSRTPGGTGTSRTPGGIPASLTYPGGIPASLTYPGGTDSSHIRVVQTLLITGCYSRVLFPVGI